MAQQLKGTPGITGCCSHRVHVEGGVWNLDGWSSFPGAEVGPTGMAAPQSKWSAARALNRLRPFCPDPQWRLDESGGLPLVTAAGS